MAERERRPRRGAVAWLLVATVSLLAFVAAGAQCADQGIAPRKGTQSDRDARGVCISHGLPTFRLDRRLLVGFGAAAKHCAFHAMSAATIRGHAGELAGYEA